MEIKTLLSTDKMRVKAVYLHGELFSVRVYVFDGEGFVENDAEVFTSGQVAVQRKDMCSV